MEYKNVTNINEMFKGCKSDLNIPIKFQKLNKE